MSNSGPTDPTFSTHNVVMNRQAALERMGGDEDILKLLGQAFLEDAPRIIGKLNESLTTRDGQKVHFYAHKIKGLASNFDANSTCKLAAEMEILGRNEAYEQAELTFKHLSFQIELLVCAVRKEVLREACSAHESPRADCT